MSNEDKGGLCTHTGSRAHKPTMGRTPFWSILLLLLLQGQVIAQTDATTTSTAASSTVVSTVTTKASFSTVGNMNTATTKGAGSVVSTHAHRPSDHKVAKQHDMYDASSVLAVHPQVHTLENVPPVLKNGKMDSSPSVETAHHSNESAVFDGPAIDSDAHSTIPVTTNTTKQNYEFTGSTIIPASTTPVPTTYKSVSSSLLVDSEAVTVPPAATHRIPFGSLLFWIYIGIATVTTLFAGVASGLTVGLLSLDPIQLKVYGEHGNDTERKSAKTVSKLVENHHLLLVTLLLANSLAMEALPLFLDRLMPSWAAVLVSVTCILFFGEVLPQAFCTGPDQLKIASAAAPFVRVLICVLFWIACPIAALLDKILARESDNYYSRPHLKTLIRMHQRQPRGELEDSTATQRRNVNAGDHRELLADEVVVIEGALDLATKKISEIMIPIEKVYMLEWDSLLTRKTLAEILRAGHSRVPVYKGNRNNVRGLLLVKTLILLNPSEEIKVKDLIYKKPLLFESPQASAYAVLNEFQKGFSHIVFVTSQCKSYRSAVERGQDADAENTILGIATLEDIIEELIQEEIYDEFDKPNPSYYSGHPTAGGSSFRMPSMSHDIVHYPSFKAIKVAGVSPPHGGETSGHEARLATLYHRQFQSSGSTGVALGDFHDTPTDTRLRFARRKLRRVSQGGPMDGERRGRSLQRLWHHSGGYSQQQSVADGRHVITAGGCAVEDPRYSVTPSGDEAYAEPHTSALECVGREGTPSGNHSPSDNYHNAAGRDPNVQGTVFRRIGSTVSDLGALGSREVKLNDGRIVGGRHTLSSAAAALFGGIDPFTNPLALNIIDVDGNGEGVAAARVPLMERDDFRLADTSHETQKK